MDTQWINTTDTEWSTLTVSAGVPLLQLNFTQLEATLSTGPFWSLYVDKQTLSFTQHSASPAITLNPASLQTLSLTQYSINIGLSDTLWEDTSDTLWEDTSDTEWYPKFIAVTPIVSLLQLNLTQYGITPAITYPANLIGVPAGSELVTNGDMELDSDWIIFNLAPSIEQSTEQVHEGNYSWKVTADGIYQGIHLDHDFPVVAGTTYRISFWTFPVSDTRCHAMSHHGDGTIGTETEWTVLTQGAWNYREIDYTETITGPMGAISLTNGNTSSNIYFDNVSVKEVGSSLASTIYSASTEITYIVDLIAQNLILYNAKPAITYTGSSLQTLNIQQHSITTSIDANELISVPHLYLNFTQNNIITETAYIVGLQTLSFTQYGVGIEKVYDTALQTLSFTQYGINPLIVYPSDLQTLSFTLYDANPEPLLAKTVNLQTLNLTQYGINPLIVYTGTALQTLSFSQYSVSIEKAYDTALQTLGFTQYGVGIETAYTVGLQTLSFTQYGINPAITYDAALQTINLTQYGINPAIVYPAGLQSLNIQSYTVTGLIGDILTAYAKHLSLSFTQNGINPAIVYPAGLQTLSFTQNSVDTEIAYPVTLQTLSFTQFGATGSTLFCVKLKVCKPAG